MPRGIDAKIHGLFRNILISPLEGEKKFLSELCELRNFREGCKKNKNKDRGTESAMTVFCRNLIILFSGMHRSCLGRSALLCRQGKNSYNKLVQHKTELKRFEPSPAFVMLTKVCKRLLPLTKREGSDSVISNNFSDTNHSQLTTHYSLKRKIAFTLAEVLITLGIIGIVSALTLPTLIANYRVSVLKNDFKKADTIIQQAIQKTVTEAGYDDINDLNIPGRQVTTENWNGLKRQITDLNEYWVKQFIGAKKITNTELNAKKHKCYSLLGKETSCFYFVFQDISEIYVLPNGMFISPLIPNNDGTNNPAQIRIRFDTNGFKGPNRMGYDMFIYESWYGYEKACLPVMQYSHPQDGCYYWARRNISPIDNSKTYWDVLYKPLSYWTNSK